MHINIYADIVFLINFIMNFLIFWIVSKLIKDKTNILKIVIGAAIGSIMYCILIFVPILRNFYNFYSAIIILVISLFVVFGFTSFKKFVQLIFYSHIVAFMVGGMGIAIYHYTNITDIFRNIVGFTNNYFSFKVLLVSIFISYITIKVLTIYIQKILIMKQSFYKVKIFLGPLSVDILALVDTGNSLSDPVSKSPVIIAEFKSIKKFLPNSMQLLFYEKKESEIFSVVDSISQSNICNKIRIIPFKSIGNSDGVLIGFKPDKVEIINKDKLIEIEDVVIGIYNLNLSSNGDYQGLLNPKLLEN